MSLGIILLFIMVLLLISVCPRGPTVEDGSMASSRGLGLTLLVLIIMLVMGGV
ncbi:DUF3309 family protein [Crenobacter oryzisoli]|uniref:DUF3309 family protein n=1 Tax=Crenobacter oryzisoli TaxID=3056844 RepID=UPI00338E3DCC